MPLPYITFLIEILKEEKYIRLYIYYVYIFYIYLLYMYVCVYIYFFPWYFEVMDHELEC